MRCNCSIDAVKLPPFTQPHFNLRRAHYEPTRYLFLLGWPFSGTSALHFLLATSNSVATVNRPGVLGPAKEGWAVSHVRAALTLGQRWNTSTPIPWQTLFDVYHSAWNLSRPILLENSPPEIIRAAELNATFSPGGKVRFLLLVRSACSKGDMWDSYANIKYLASPLRLPANALRLYSRMGAHSRSIIDDFKEDVFVLRYEDLCLRWNETLQQITAWEPRLGDMDISRVPDGRRGGGAGHRQLQGRVTGHEQVSVSTYCKAARSAWQWRVMQAPGLPRGSCAKNSSRQLPQNVSDACEMATYFGYEQIDTCA